MKDNKTLLAKYLSAIVMILLAMFLAFSRANSAAVENTEPVHDEAGNLSVEEGKAYTSKEEVALYLHLYGDLPSNYITKEEAEDLGWKKKKGRDGDLDVVAPGMSIDGSRGAERIVYSNDGLIFYTGDHYQTFEQLYPQPDQ